MRNKLLALVVLVALLAGSFYTSPSGDVSAQEPQDVSIGAIQYEDINNEFEPALAPWDWQMLGADYHLRVKEGFTSGQIMEFEVGGSTIQLQPMGLEWSNDLSQIQQVSMPQDVTPVVTNPDQEGTIVWNDAYGSNIDFEWKSTPIILNKTLTISSLSDLPAPQQYIIDGGNPFLRLNLIFDPSTDLDIYVDDNMWDKATKVQSFNNIEFRKDGQMLWAFMPLLYWDSEGNEGQSVATLEKSGNSLYISIRVPYSWLQTASYPVYVDADVTIEAAASTLLYIMPLRGGPFWTSPTVGYVIYPNASHDLVYRKTADGGANWAAAVSIAGATVGNIAGYDCWADWQTAGDAGTKIHIVYASNDTEEVRYVYLDTDGDSVAGDDLIETCQGTGVFVANYIIAYLMVSITKTRGGNLAVAIKYKDNASTDFDSFYTSPDGDTWTSKTSPYEIIGDYCLLFPGNEADNQDVWGVYWDVDAEEISLKTFDDDGDSWSAGTLISGSMEPNITYLQMDGAIRLSDGHLLLAAWSEYNSGTADLMTWDINGEGSIAAKTDVLANSDDSMLVSVFINQDNDDWYVAYAKGGTVQALTTVYYQLSQNGGAGWDGQAAMQANAADDERWISCGAVKAAWGGKFQPVWFNDDLNDLFTNTDNGISIAASIGIVAPTVVTNAASNIEETTATLSGNITATGGDNCTDRGFQWDVDTGVPYADSWTEVGDFGVGNFTHGVTSLPTGTTIYYRASANNSAGWGYGAEVTFLTKPAAPTNIAATDGAHTDKVVVTWTKSTGATGYKVYEGVNLLDTLGDVATYDDAAAPAGSITNSGNVTASDGTSSAHVTLSLANEATANGAPRTYKVKALNGTGDSGDSATDTGYRGVGVITYQWQRSAADADAGYGNIAGGTTDPYNDTGAPVYPAARYFQCIVSSVDASNSPQTSDSDRGYRGEAVLPVPRVPAVPLVQPIGEKLSLILAGCVVVLFSEFSFWRRNCLMFMLAAGASVMVGFYFYDVYTTNLGLSIGILLVAYGLACLVFALRCIFWRGKRSEE